MPETTTTTAVTDPSTPAAVPVSGIRTVLEHGPYRAEIAGVGATLRSLTHDGRDLVVPFGVDEVRPLYRGALLAPWPNRVVDGSWDDDGVERQLPLNEIERGHALHGLVQWADWASDPADEADAHRTSLVTQLAPSDGYPYRLELRAVYELGDAGLVTTVTATNVGQGTAPYGVAPHPYLVAGEGRVDDWSLLLPAASYLEVTEERLVPTGVHGVTEREGFDFREARPVGDLFVDHAFTEIDADAEGRATVEVVARDGRGVAMSWAVSELPWVQVHTGDRPEPELDRLGLAVEPMTCPPDAFTSGVDLVRLAPGESHTASWTIAAMA
ncbi:aldose 1-epimerase family protein [Frigoribacterium sp. CFBP 13729]|uniref:aldose 1-epimerase family protein n=1 Tax=Frigoribacterium sp. CFBP 13729 TaxID=2775293 RepID=UPI00352F8FD5